MSSCIVIATRNEADNVAGIVQLALRFGDVLVVDNASTDDTVEIADRAGAEVIRHHANEHIRHSYVDGFRHVMKRYRYVVQMDAGGSHSPDDIGRLLRPLEMGWFDAAIAWRKEFIEHPFYRIALSKTAGRLIRYGTGMPYRDPTSGFRSYRGSVLQELDSCGVFDLLEAKAHAFQFELLWYMHQMGIQPVEIPVTYRGSKSSVRLWVVWEAVRTLARLRRLRREDHVATA